MQPLINLSVNDSKILNAVFDPESAPEAPKVTVDPLLPPDPQISNLGLLTALRAQEAAMIRLVERCTPARSTLSDDSEAQQEDKDAVYKKALHILNGITADHPNYASAYNNKAQLRRWRFGDRGVLAMRSSSEKTSPEAASAIMETLRDLDTVIRLASPSKTGAVSVMQGKLLAQAWTQRAAVFWGAAKDLAHEDAEVVEGEWEDWDTTRFEEEGSRCFFIAGLYGSEMGRAMAVMSNPTAKLCGNIVREALKRERCSA